MKVLYFGLTPPPSCQERTITHCPLIRVDRRNTPEVRAACQNLEAYTHLLFTSQSAVIFFLNLITKPFINHKVFSIGASTTRRLQQLGIQVTRTAQDETSEGVLALLQEESMDNAHLFWPHSALSRPLIEEQLKHLSIRHTCCHLYDTHPVRPESLPNLHAYDEIVFTSPSTVSAFFSLFSAIPPHIKVTCIGPVTEGELIRRGISIP